MSQLSVVILAAGKGTRMKSRLPKVLHKLAGQELLRHVINTARALKPDQLIVVTGHEGEQVRGSFAGDADIEWIEQSVQKGTGHAVQQALPIVFGETTLVLYGDVPLTKVGSLQRLIGSKEGAACSILTMVKENPTGYGRIIRSQQNQQPSAIVEQKDASSEELKVKEVNTGILVANTQHLTSCLERLSPNNAQGELYLTDVVELLVAANESVHACTLTDENEAEGVNSRAQLENLERIYQRSLAEQLMAAGNTLADAHRIDIRGKLSTGTDNYIDVNCVFEGNVNIGDDVSIGPNCYLKDCTIGSGTQLLANTIVESSIIGEQCEIGPFARVRPGTDIARKGKLGNFVEIKKSRIGEGSKVNHLSYIGDCQMGSGVNVGAGTITCNYDGANKHLTVIGDGVFVGSNSSLIAPIKIGNNATIGAGSALSFDAPADALTYARPPLKSSKAWKRPVKKQK